MTDSQSQPATNKTPASVWRNPLHFVAFGFGSGAAPVAPGTFGTVVGVLVYWLFHDLPLLNYLLVILVGFAVGIRICGQTARDLGVHDHGGIVWDEIIGFLITMTAIPFAWQWVLLGFVLFRIFDIVKPWPIRQLDESVPGGLGIMLDDVLAGLYAWVVLAATVYWFG